MDPYALARRSVEAHAEALVSLSHRIHANPEIAWQEEHSSAWTAELVERAGSELTSDFCSMPTAFKATLGSGPLRIAVCAEYDSLPDLGHACGHNIIAAAAAGVAFGLKDLVDDLGIELVVLGTPAEEGGGGKAYMLERGGFEGVHAAMMIHPAPVDSARALALAASRFEIKFRGQASHAAAYPEFGRNAADAMTIAQVAIGLLRQQSPDTTRVHGLVTRGGEAVNAIPEDVRGSWFVRAETAAELETYESRVSACFEAGAIASGTAVTIDRTMPTYLDFRNDEVILGHFVNRAHELGRRFIPDGDPRAKMNRSSTDMGNVSHHLPSIHPFIGIGGDALNHQVGFTTQARTPTADKAVVDGAVAMAHTIIDLALESATREHLLAKRVN